MRKFLTTSAVLILLLLLNSASVAADNEAWNRAKRQRAAAKNKALVKLDLYKGNVDHFKNRSYASPTSPTSLSKAANEEVIYSENFDTGAPGWKFIDLWSESSWHTSTTGALSGQSYWCSVEELGGYDDLWLRTLTSPAITLPASSNLSLSFMHDYGVEDTVGTSGDLGPFDAWDGVHVRLSTDGTTFNVITPTGGYPASNVVGYYFYYGDGLPGWFGSSGGWVEVTFDLSAYSGQTVWIQFQFASDPSVSSGEDPSLYGWRVDDITVKDGATTVFSDDAGDTGAAQFVSGGPGGPNLWHLTDRAANSAPNSAGCFDPATGNYLPRMENAMYSPAIAIDDLPEGTYQLIPDFLYQGVLDTIPDPIGEVDLVVAEARGYSDGVWGYWNYIGITGGIPESFGSYNEFNTDFPMDVSYLIGTADSVQIHFRIFSAPDDTVVPPANVFVDDFTLTALNTPAAPAIVSVLDIPEDQGRQVRVTWLPSLSESLFDAVSHYVLWRKVEGAAAAKNDVITVQDMAALHDYATESGELGDRIYVAAANQAWDFIASVPSHLGFESYNYVAPTLADSNASGMNLATFMVSAYARAGGFTDSEEASGYSVDNLAPGVPANFAAQQITVDQRFAVQLTWKASEDEDFAYFALYKDDGAEPVLKTTDSTYVDTQVSVGERHTYRLTSFDFNGNESQAAEATLLVTSVEDRTENKLPTEYALGNNYPNPFNPQTKIEFALVEAGKVSLTIYNALGEEVGKLVDAEMPAGFHQVAWDAKNHASGVYFYRLMAKNFSEIKKMVLMR